MTAYSVFSILINPIDFRFRTRSSDFSPIYISITFTNFNRLDVLDDTFFKDFSSYLGFSPVRVFKKERKNSLAFINTSFSVVRSAKYIFFSTSENVFIQHFFKAFFNFKTGSNENLLSLSTKFFRGTSIFEFSNLLISNFTDLQKYSFKNFIELNENDFFERNFYNYTYLLKNYIFFFFQLRITFFCFRFFFFKNFKVYLF